MGLQKGCKPNNPAGRKVGSTNRFSFSAKMKLDELIDEEFITHIFATIEKIENPKDKVFSMIRVLDFIIAKPRDIGEVESEILLKSALMDRIFPKKDD